MTIEQPISTPVIHVGLTDHLDPEVQAMLSAMYSRSYAPIESRLPSSDESMQEHKEKLGKFYVGYNHKSVGQLASTTIWLEGISQLAAKAVENHPLYNGQESSTRYMDFTNQPMVSHNESIKEWQEKWRALYVKALPLTVEMLKKQFPLESQPPETKQTVWENTVKARAFDICRGLLPAGVTTNVAFTGSFDLINDHFGEMLYHPSKEMRYIAEEVLTKLAEKYKYAAIPIEKLKERFSYVQEEYYSDYFYKNIRNDIPDQKYDGICIFADFHNMKNNPKRKKFDKYPTWFTNQITLFGRLDFGSYRDLHRHRNGIITMPTLTPFNGFNKFYLDNLPKEIVEELLLLSKEYVTHCLQNENGIRNQYSTPMGYNVDFTYTCGINQLNYILELRTGKTVHQSLRKLCHEWIKILIEKTNNNFTIHADMDEDNFSLKRGAQTFTDVK